jgi:DNA-binding NarL/FixJ family response regulator
VADNTVPEHIRIVIADDHPLFRDGLRNLLESDPQFRRHRRGG